MFEMDESEHTAKEPAKWWELLDDASAYVRFHYEEIQQHGSDELKRAVEIVLGGHRPGGMPIKGESA
jgi:hypothetical protein